MTMSADDRIMLDLETDYGTFKPDQFASLAAGTLTDFGVEICYGELTVKVTAEAVRQLYGEVAHPISRSRVLHDHFELIDNLVKARPAHEGGILTIDVNDLDAA